MSALKNIAMVALASLMAAPLSAQVMSDSTVHERIETVRGRIDAARRRAETARASTRADSARQGRHGSHKVPKGQLPPRGKCRVWIDGVPPGQQPAVTDCATAEANRTSNSRVIYGDSAAFPGKGKGKFKHRDAQQSRVGRGDDDDRFEDDGKRGRLSKAEKRAAKAARKGNRGGKQDNDTSA